MEFQRHIAIDWSGAGLDSARNSAIAVADHDGIVTPPIFKTWSRLEIDAYLGQVLDPSAPRTIVAIDAALSFSDGFQDVVFGVESWTDMVLAFGRLGEQYDTARQIGRAINESCPNAGPFRFDDSRNYGIFYVEHGVAYHRAVELLMPQCISPYYLGSGATVGFHAITCLCTLARLMALRDAGEVAFHVWPQESPVAPADSHVIVECYPAMYPKIDDSALNGHQQDAMRTLRWIRAADKGGALTGWLQPPESRVGQRQDRTWQDQIRFEGWVLGV